jgi:ribosomal protein S18 acetylase RimI-like enzyme
VHLQVRDDNEAALHLYRSLAFQRLFSTTLWRAAAPVAPAGGLERGWRLADWGPDGRWAAESLLTRAGDIEGPAPGPIRQALARLGWRGRLTDSLHGLRRQRQALVADARWAAVAATVAGGAQAFEIRVDPRWRGQAEEPLLAWALERLGGGRGSGLDTEVREEEQGLVALLPAAGFRPVRTLERLAKGL